jgi:hypothetical protein
LTQIRNDELLFALQRSVALRRLGKLREALKELELSFDGRGVEATHLTKDSWFPRLPLNFVVCLFLAELKDELKDRDVKKPTFMPATISMLNDLISSTNLYSSVNLAKQQAANFILANLFICMGHWRLTLGVLTKARSLIRKEIKKSTSKSALHLVLSWRCSSLDYYIGCVFLQLGCTNAAASAFGFACKWVQLAIFRSPAQNYTVDFGQQYRTVNYSCRCLVLFTRGSYSNAMGGLEENTNTKEKLKKTMLLSQCLIPTASELINNEAICALYSCDLERSIFLIETAVWSDPLVHLCEVTVFNLCTLYDLSSNNKSAIKRKKNLQEFTVQHSVQDIDSSLFRISG